MSMDMRLNLTLIDVGPECQYYSRMFDGFASLGHAACRCIYILGHSY